MALERNYNDYADFNAKKKSLAGMLEQSSDVIQDLNMEQYSDNLRKLSEKVENDTFKIQIVGTFKNGKSTFINSLLGEYVLPAYALPCTAVINEVKYGKEKRAVLYFKNPLPEKLPDSIPQKAMQHMQQHNMTNIPPLEIGYDEIEAYVTIPMGSDPQQMMLESPYEKVELFWPLPILEHGVEIIDSPGLNEHSTRTKVTMDYLSKADAIIFVFTAQALCSQEEMSFIENHLHAQGFEDPFFVVNRWDQIEDREKPQVEKFAKMKLDGYSSNEIFFISALHGLKSKEQGDAALYEASGVKHLEEVLTEFLTKKKGKVKLAQPAKELKRILNTEALYKVIPSQRSILSSSLDDVKKRYEIAKPQLATLRAKKEQLISKMKLQIEQSKHEFRRISLQNSTSLTDLVPAWIDECKPVTQFGLVPTKAKGEAITKEISEYVTQKIEDEQVKWQHDVLEPLVQEKSKVIFDSNEENIQEILSTIDQVNIDISGREDMKYDKVPTWERIAGVAAGVVLGCNLGVIFSAGVHGLSKELAKSIGIQIGSFVVLGLVGLLNPFTILAVILSVAAFDWIRAGEKAMKNLKKTIKEQMVNQISESSEATADELSNNIVSKLNEATLVISTAIDTEINETEKNVNSIIAEMEKGQENIQEREKVITDCENRIKDLSNSLDALIFQLVEE